MTESDPKQKRRPLAKRNKSDVGALTTDYRPKDDKKMFITTASEETKLRLQRCGFVYFAKSMGRYFFSYDERKMKVMRGFDKLEDIEFTDILTFDV